MITQGHANVIVAGDSSTCRRCRNVWDTNDASPPPCFRQFTFQDARTLLIRLKEKLGDNAQSRHHMRPHSSIAEFEHDLVHINTVVFRVLDNDPSLCVEVEGLPTWNPVTPLPAPPPPAAPVPGQVSTGLKLGNVDPPERSPVPEMSVAEAFAARDAYREAHPEIVEAYRNAQPTAHTILQDAAQHMLDRAAARDQPTGERSMARCVTAFNALTGHSLSERDGWMFMVVLKAARACNTPAGQLDDYQDLAAYSALCGEAAAK